VGKWRKMLLQLVGRAAGGNEMDLVEVKAAIGGTRDRKMSIVYRIERAAKNGDAARMMFCGGGAALARWSMSLLRMTSAIFA
jgi:hypothetical protein